MSGNNSLAHLRLCVTIMTLKDELQDAATRLMEDPTGYYKKLINASDPRVADWMWMQSPLPTLSLITLYLITVNIGPKIMKDREPFDMKPLLFVFNGLLVVFNFWMALEVAIGMIGANYTYWACVPLPDYSYDPYELQLARVLWWYYFAKCIEFSDTIFFILRKKNDQITFLHVYHHASMFFFWWIGVKWVAGGQSVKGPMVNSFVHVVMYSYYALSALGPKMRPYLWWKHHITHLQLFQFFMGVFHMSYSLYEGCNFPKWMHYLGLSYLASLVVLFTNFYVQAYIKGRRKGGSQTKGIKMKSGHLATNGTAISSLQNEGKEKKDN